MGQLTKNFTLEEMLRSDAAVRKSIIEQFNPAEEIIDNLTLLCVNLLQPLRDYVASSIRITSAYRCHRLNTLIGGSPTSDHTKGLAVDAELYRNGAEHNLLLAKKLLESGLDFKELIMEFGTALNPGWIHMSWEQGSNNKEIMVAQKSITKTVYKVLSLQEAHDYVKLAA